MRKACGKEVLELSKKHSKFLWGVEFIGVLEEPMDRKEITLRVRTKLVVACIKPPLSIKIFYFSILSKDKIEEWGELIVP